MIVGAGPRKQESSSRITTKILVVDQDPVIVTTLRTFLEGKGYDVVTASDGVEAVESVRHEQPKVVLLDIHTPKQRALEVLKAIKEYNKDIGVIMLTPVTDDEAGREALKLGAFDYVTKPFTLEYLDKVLWWTLKMME